MVRTRIDSDVRTRVDRDVAHRDVAEFFGSIGADIKCRWRASDFDEAAFTDIATETLAGRLRSSWMSLDDVLSWVQGSASLPTQVDYPFGDPITVFHDPRFYIDVLTWIDGTTSIHEHAFSGAFGVLQGSSLHARYTFHPERRYSEQLLLGRTERIDAELLTAEDVRPIWAGARSAHALFHLERPSVSIVIRTPKTATIPPVQLEYLRSGIAYHPFYRDVECARMIRSLEIMRELKHPNLLRAARALVDERDAVTAFSIAEHLALKLSPDDYQGFLAEGGFRHRELFELIAAHAADARRERTLIARRRAVHAESHRFLLALLLNLNGLSEIKRMVERYAPGPDPGDTVMRWVSELAAEPATEPNEPNAIGVALDEAGLGIMRLLLDGNTDDAVLGALSAEYEGVNELQAELRELCAAFRSSVLFSPLFKS
jgi:hypothetical protein